MTKAGNYMNSFWYGVKLGLSRGMIPMATAVCGFGLMHSFDVGNTVMGIVYCALLGVNMILAIFTGSAIKIRLPSKCGDTHCTCPLCRFSHGELSVSEIAWYLKGSIEHQSHYLHLIKSVSSLDELKEKVQYDVVDLEGDYILLKDLKHESHNPDGWWDVAMDSPETFCLPKENKHEST